MKPRRVIVNDLMQTNYVYVLTEPTGQHFHADFLPELTPKEMLELGVFGGKYMTDCSTEFPGDWFEDAKLCQERHDSELNFFGVNASKPLAYWREKSWLHADDPRGWFQWHCGYYMGRRCEDDERQIKRWRAMARHVAQITRTAKEETGIVDAGNVRRYSTGHTTLERSSLRRHRLKGLPRCIQCQKKQSQCG